MVRATSKMGRRIRRAELGAVIVTSLSPILIAILICVRESGKSTTRVSRPAKANPTLLPDAPNGDTDCHKSAGAI